MIVVLVSFGGADYVDPSGVGETSEAYQVCSYNVGNLANQIANFATSNGFDRVDIDFEDSSAFHQGGPYDGVQFPVELAAPAVA